LHHEYSRPGTGLIELLAEILRDYIKPIADFEMPGAWRSLDGPGPCAPGLAPMANAAALTKLHSPASETRKCISFSRVVAPPRVRGLGECLAAAPLRAANDD